MICRLYAAQPEEADDQPVTLNHAAAQQGQPAHQRSDDQKQTEADQRVAPIQHRPECRQDGGSHFTLNLKAAQNTISNSATASLWTMIILVIILQL